MLQNMSSRDVPDIVRTMRKQSSYRGAVRIGIIDTVSLDCEPPRLVKCRLVIGCILAVCLYSFDKQRARIPGISQQDRPVPFNVFIQEFIEVEQIG